MADSLIELMAPPWYSQTSPGVTPPFLFTENGNVGINKWLRIGNVDSSLTAFPIFGRNRIVKMRAAAQGTVTTDTVIQLYDRTAITTYSLIAGATITIPAGQYEGSIQYSPSISLREDVELAAKIVSGSTLQNPVLCVFLMPRT